MRKTVDFPAPFGPTKAVTAPGRTVKLTASAASIAPRADGARGPDIMVG